MQTTDAQALENAQLTVVTVTYGDRWHLLSQQLDYLEAHKNIARVIVIDNGARRPIADLVALSGVRKAMVIRNPHNLGSAAGYKQGLDTALTSGAEWILLLDDDNVPEPLTLEKLLTSATALTQGDQQQCAFLAFRPEHQKDIASGVAVKRCIPARSSFFGFHIVDIPYKIWRRLPWGRPTARHGIPPLVALPFAPYSGLCFHRHVVEKIGMPEVDLVLYADDTEFSYRITQAGGRIWLLTDAPLRELEPSWNSKGRSRSTFEGWLKGGSDLRVYYGSRNQAYFDSQYWTRNRRIYQINRFVYLLILRWCAWRYRRFERYALIRQAVVMGEHRKLGLAAEYPLQ